MRTFSSYGPVDVDENYYVPRKELVDRAYRQLAGKNINKGGHYITVWAPRQTGKSWVMNLIVNQLQSDPRFYAAKVELQIESHDTLQIVNYIFRSIGDQIGKKFPRIEDIEEFQYGFQPTYLDKPLILILDEFDSLSEENISNIVNAFRNIYNIRKGELTKTTFEKSYMLHGVALIGVRSVLGIENVKGSPFNVQRSIHIPNLTFEEVDSMFKWYEKESGQKVAQQVIDQLFYECKGQPGLTCWFGELLTETFNPDKTKPITMRNFKRVYVEASQVLPNNNILNIISKAKQEPFKTEVLELFKTEEKKLFRFDNPEINFLYMNGVVDLERMVDERGDDVIYTRFSCPFVHKRLFNYFSYDLFDYMGRLVEPFESQADAVSAESLNIKNIIKRYQKYLQKNRGWLFKDVPRRKDLRIFEAVYHFNLYRFLSNFLENKGGTVHPEFPTGNGKVDLLIRYRKKIYALELKSYTDESGYRVALKQAAFYGDRLGLKEIDLILFVELIDEKNRQKYEAVYFDKENGVTVKPVFVQVYE